MNLFAGYFILLHFQYNVSCAPSIGQYGALEGLKKSMYHIEYIKEDLKLRRDYVYERLINMGLKTVKPKGAFIYSHPLQILE